MADQFPGFEPIERKTAEARAAAEKNTDTKEES